MKSNHAKIESIMANSNLTNAKKAKNDEFYTQYSDIQKEIEAYLEYNPNVFRSKVVYCNCDDPFESNFFRSWLRHLVRQNLLDTFDLIGNTRPHDNDLVCDGM